jgi:PAS domain S-box-containing protein
MKPPPPPSAYSLPSTLSTAGILKQTTASPHATIAPMPGAAGGKIMPAAEGAVGGAVTSMPTGNKKQHKRAANRRSAQLSRKRKKLFIEELKEENDELRRKEQILRSIPDLIVVFDSSGKLWFVSQSVSRFLDMIPEELEGTSFWDRLCEDSVRLLKAAFMDALAARKSDSESAPLGSGVWELRLVDKDGGYKVVTLNGVVHFSGDSPECVCCIRPRDQQSVIPLQKKAKGASHRIRAVSSSDGSRSSVENAREHPQIRIKPHQSVINAETPDEARMASRKQAAPNDEGSADAIGRQAVRISDGDSGSIVSESGSDEGVVSN